MKHRVGFNRLGKKPSHRTSMMNSMVTSLFKHERITTTIARAKEARRVAEKMITRAKVDSVHNRRLVAKKIRDTFIVNKLFTDISPRFVERPGGYTRILKIGTRNNDSAQMVILELVEKVVAERVKKEPVQTEEPEVAEEEEAAVEADTEAQEDETAEEETAEETEDEPEAEAPEDEEKASADD